MLGLSFNICSKNCKTLVFTETTGEYSPTNTPGWNAPNADIDDCESAILKIYDPSNTLIATLDLFDTGLPDPNDTTATHFFPNDSYQSTAFNFYQGLIYNTDLGYLAGDAIPDGGYTFVYEVVVDGTTYTKTKYYGHYCTVQCCVDKLIAKIPDSTCCCDDETLEKVEGARAILAGLINAAECFKKERFKRLLRILQRICDNNDCNCN